MNVRDAAHAAHVSYRHTKREAVRLSGDVPADAPSMIEVHRRQGTIQPFATDPLRSLASICTELARDDVSIVVYNNDAFRRPFSNDATAHDPSSLEEVLSTIAVGADGDLATVASTYHYEDRPGEPSRLVFRGEEYDTLPDAEVVAALRRIFT